MTDHHHDRGSPIRTHAAFPTGTEGLPASSMSEVIDVSGGDEIELRIAPVAKRIGGVTVRMLAYNGSVPGPTLRVRQGTEVA